MYSNRKLTIALTALIPLALSGHALAQSFPSSRPSASRTGETLALRVVRDPVVDLKRQARLRRPGQVLAGDQATAFNPLPEPTLAVEEMGNEENGLREAVALSDADAMHAPASDEMTIDAKPVHTEAAQAEPLMDDHAMAKVGGVREPVVPIMAENETLPAPESIVQDRAAYTRDDVAAPGETGSRMVAGDSMAGAIKPVEIAQDPAMPAREEHMPEATPVAVIEPRREELEPMDLPAGDGAMAMHVHEPIAPVEPMQQIGSSITITDISPANEHSAPMVGQNLADAMEPAAQQLTVTTPVVEEHAAIRDPEMTEQAIAPQQVAMAIEPPTSHVSSSAAAQRRGGELTVLTPTLIASEESTAREQKNVSTPEAKSVEAPIATLPADGKRHEASAAAVSPMAAPLATAKPAPKSAEPGVREPVLDLAAQSREPMTKEAGIVSGAVNRGTVREPVVSLTDEGTKPASTAESAKPTPITPSVSVQASPAPAAVSAAPAATANVSTGNASGIGAEKPFRNPLAGNSGAISPMAAPLAPAPSPAVQPAVAPAPAPVASPIVESKPVVTPKPVERPVVVTERPSVPVKVRGTSPSAAELSGVREPVVSLEAQAAEPGLSGMSMSSGGAAGGDVGMNDAPVARKIGPTRPVEAPSIVPQNVRDSVIALDDPSSQPASVLPPQSVAKVNDLRTRTPSSPLIDLDPSTLTWRTGNARAQIVQVDGSANNAQWRLVGEGASPEGPWISLKTGDELTGQVEVRTGVGTSVFVQVDGHAVVEIDRLSRVRIQRAVPNFGEPIAGINVLRGRVQVRGGVNSGASGAGIARVETPDQTINVRTDALIEYNAFTGTRQSSVE